MRITVQAPVGTVAESPAEALSALADIAEADGACRAEWLAKAVEADRPHQHEQPAYQPVKDVGDAAAELHDRVMVSMRAAIRQRLEQAASDADTGIYIAMAQLPKE